MWDKKQRVYVSNFRVSLQCVLCYRHRAVEFISLHVKTKLSAASEKCRRLVLLELTTEYCDKHISEFYRNFRKNRRQCY